MDKHGVEMMILSLNAPAVQAIHDVKTAIEVARQSNDVLADHVRKRPDRFAAFAALPMQNPDAAIVELGANDGLRGLEPKDMEANLTVILDELAAKHIPVLLTGMYAPPNLGAPCW